MASKTIIALVAVAFLAGTMASSAVVFADKDNENKGNPFKSLTLLVQKLQVDVDSLKDQIKQIPNQEFKTYMKGATHQVPNNTGQNFVLSCNPGDTLISGGYDVSFGTTSEPILSSFPTPNGWQVNTLNTSGQDITVDLYAICHAKP